MSFTVIRSDAEFEALGDEFMKLDAHHNLVRGYGFEFADFAAQPMTMRYLVALLDEYMKLDVGYGLKSQGHTLQHFLERPWYFRNLTELMHDSGGFRPLLSKQRIASMRADKEYLRPETRKRLQAGQVFQPLHHHRFRRAGVSRHFTRKDRP